MTSYAQRGHTLNFLNLVPQQNNFNPAFYTNYDSYFGIPLFSSIHLQLHNDVLSLDGLRQMHVPSLISSLSSENSFGLDFSLDLFSHGWRVRETNSFIHIGFGVEAYGNALLARNSLSFLLTGPGNFVGQHDVLSGNFIDMSAYASLSFGYSHEINERWRVGGRIKLLSGIANFYSERLDIDIYIDQGLDPNVVPYTYFITPDITINQFIDWTPRSIIDNWGLGFDIGAVYRVDDFMTFAVSVNDIGFINWGSNGVERITTQNRDDPFVFSGVWHIGDIITDNGFEVDEIFSAFTDSLRAFFQLDETDTTFTSYRSPLRTSYNISGFFNLSDNDQIGIMWNSRLGQWQSRSLTVAYTRSFGPNFQMSINNAMINNNPFNFGGGFAFNLGRFQFYAVAEKINSFRVIHMRAANIHFGFNLVFNRPTERELVRRGFANSRWI
ncbi:MAG: DUF5723 family protein [Bacteroidales bacterium]|nr:DUF5723 family protein [Bacteroidales bacterium]